MGSSTLLDIDGNDTNKIVCGICYKHADDTDQANLTCCEAGKHMHQTCWTKQRNTAWLDQNGTLGAKKYNGLCPFCRRTDGIPKPKPKKQAYTVDPKTGYRVFNQNGKFRGIP